MDMLSSVSADYTMFCDQDDVWYPDKVEKTFRTMRKAEEESPAAMPVCVYSDVTVVDEKLNTLSESFYTYSALYPDRTSLTDRLWQNLAPGCTMMINRPLCQISLLTDVTDLFHMHDWHLILLAIACGKAVRIPEALMAYRQHSDNEIGATKRTTPLQKLRHLLSIRTWLDTKKTYVETRRNNAMALLKNLEVLQSAKAGTFALNDDYDDNVAALKRFLDQHSKPLMIRILYMFRWRWFGR